ncbi:hypothetical protein [Turneriella parva]|uniref:AAA+ ATPase domain-containing protein n=1 Tax=Turneriella parva (strain ATCC BAA-1111 / DSM 21527 / NCTC 11395 / H) TaxID=869212 RepID=I4BAB8_TURPD|nr:hypothetical protein [Turneriella parva]AFM14225.1 hypothetical protein Turpa_3591 [Turneriella parva DSM 21527]
MAKDYQVSFQNLKALIQENTDKDFKKSRNEATTRLHLINKVFFDCLDWIEADCIAENYDGQEYHDYSFMAPGIALIVEAKREGVYFELPLDYSRTKIKLRHITESNKQVKAAVEQVAMYGLRKGCRVVAITNGTQYVGFLTFKQNQELYEGNAIVFDSLERIRDNFTEFWNCFSKQGIERAYLSINLDSSPTNFPPAKISESIPDFPVYKRRNHLQSELVTLAEMVIAEISDLSEIRKVFLDNCYCDSGALSQYSLQARNILQARYAGLFPGIQAPSIETIVNRKSGVKGEVFDISFARKPIIILGDVGIGKTTFMHNLFENVIPAKQLGIVLIHIDLGLNAIIETDLGGFILDQIEKQLIENFKIDITESSFITGVYHSQLSKFERGIAKDLKVSNPSLYDKERYEFLKNLVGNREKHLKNVIDHFLKARNQKLVLILDNLDQRSESDQEKGFLIATEFTAQHNLPVFISLRPDTFHRSVKTGSLSAYHPTAYTISPPRIDEVLRKRLEFALKIVKGEIPLERIARVSVQLKNLQDFIEIMLYSLSQNAELYRFLDNVSNSNVRRALEFIKTFMKSGHINTDDIIDRYNRHGLYLIPKHAITRAVIFGEYKYFDAKSSPIVNIYDIIERNKAEHFLGLIILEYLESKMNQNIDYGYSSFQEIFNYAQSKGFLDRQVKAKIENLFDGKLIEDNVHSGNITAYSNEVRLRITANGLYMIKYLSREFVYLDAVVVDTPILDTGIKEAIDVQDALIEARLDNAREFLIYLTDCATEASIQGFDWTDYQQDIEKSIELAHRKYEERRARNSDAN